MPTPEEYAAERLAARAAKYHAEVDRLRALLTAPADHDGAHNDQPEEGNHA
jgi:hypothetical protein